MTDVDPVKPRDDSAAPPLPGWPRLDRPGARLMASTSEASPRSSICSRGITSTLAGVCMGVRPRFEPVEVFSDNAVCGLAWTVTVASSGTPEAVD